MSRIGKTPVEIPSDVTVSQSGQELTFKGPKGEIRVIVPPEITAVIEKSTMTFETAGVGKRMQAVYGYIRAHAANSIIGVTKGWERRLELVGVGYRAVMEGSDIILTVGFSHPVVIKPPTGVSFAIVEGKVVIRGIDKQLVGQMAANIRSVKVPEPYKGKGIRYEGERIRKKAGKAAKAVGGAGGGAK